MAHVAHTPSSPHHASSPHLIGSSADGHYSMVGGASDAWWSWGLGSLGGSSRVGDVGQNPFGPTLTFGCFRRFRFLDAGTMNGSLAWTALMQVDTIAPISFSSPYFLF